MTEDDRVPSVGPIIYFGTYDLGKPRNRLMTDALRRMDIEVIEINSNIWSDIEDKTQTTIGTRTILVFRWLLSYPYLVWRYLRAPRHRIVAIGYPGHLDVLVLRPFAWIRGASIAFDAFLSLYDTVIEDRRLASPKSFTAQLLRFWERWACRTADLVILDTNAQAAMFADLYELAPRRMGAVMVGAEAEHFPRLPPRCRLPGDQFRVLFYGQFIPLHGVRTIVEAARLSRDAGDEIAWVIIGSGQEAGRVLAEVDRDPVPRLNWLEWMPYEELHEQLARADVALGIFGTSSKAARVIPNKAFQILSTGRPLVTRDGPAIRELVPPGTPGVRLVPAGDARALLAAVKDLGESGEVPPETLTSRFSPESRGEKFARLLVEMIDQ